MRWAYLSVKQGSESEIVVIGVTGWWAAQTAKQKLGDAYE
jgi:hypothetical protein